MNVAASMRVHFHRMFVRYIVACNVKMLSIDNYHHAWKLVNFSTAPPNSYATFSVKNGPCAEIHNSYAAMLNVCNTLPCQHETGSYMRKCLKCDSTPKARDDDDDGMENGRVNAYNTQMWIPALNPICDCRMLIYFSTMWLDHISVLYLGQVFRECPIYCYTHL